MAKKQVLSDAYIRAITGDDSRAEGQESLNILKADVEQKLRATGARYIKLGVETLPQSFFLESQDNDEGSDEPVEKSRSPDARL